MTEPMTDSLSEFVSRVETDLLPSYCRAKGYPEAGFKRESLGKVTSADARNCLRAIDEALLERLPNQRFTMPRNTATEILFWEGSTQKVPRPITLWLEPVITFAAIARLHFDFGWPKELLATQPKSWAFDISASFADHGDREHIVGEVKKSSKEIDVLLRDLNSFCSEPRNEEPPKGDPRRNAFKKWDRLRAIEAPIFWAIGPGSSDIVFNVDRQSDGRIILREIPVVELRYREPLSSSNSK